MIHVIATITVRPGRRADFLAAFKRLMPKVHAEDGCLAYEPTADVTPAAHAAQPAPRAEVITIVERWRDLKALQAHFAAPHMAAWRVEAESLVASVQLHILEPA